ncbi:hypothetical protein SteCoe_7926 [Stentor coeruleus]|uniref:G-patch domain-containing protein n=1 Tax=Stentor coeruleus TaxID=5963 RepID=A0A1R2CLE8_9CILI|nr:hypothetical protein SteCoe_7926 [Stentor coeruleus]
MQEDFIPFDSDEDIPNKRHRLTKEEQLYGVFYEKPTIIKKNIQKPAKQLDESQLEQTYGKGFALLQKNGYKVGEGLGKNSQGTTSLLGMHMRKKNEGLSFSKPEKQEDFTQPQIKSNKKPKYDKKINDEPKVTNNPDEPEDEPPASKVLMTKINVLENSLYSLQYEEKQIIEGLTELDVKEFELVEMLEILSKTNESWSDLLKAFIEIQNKSSYFYHELFIHENYTIKIFRKYFKKIWKNWVFKKAPLKGLEKLKQWEIIGNPKEVIDIWVEAVKKFFNKKWKPKKEIGKNIDALEIWKGHIPTETWDEIQKIIIARLSLEIDLWNPIKDHITIHTWIHPWLVLINLTSLYPKIINKFIGVLQNWNPKDSSAKIVLSPWKPIFGKEWNDIMVMHILPKLLYFLQEMKINKDVECIKNIKHVLIWVGLIPFDHLTKGFEKIFYPRWKKALESMLENNCNMDTVVNWVDCWKKVIPSEVIVLEI